MGKIWTQYFPVCSENQRDFDIVIMFSGMKLAARKIFTFDVAKQQVFITTSLFLIEFSNRIIGGFFCFLFGVFYI